MDDLNIWVEDGEEFVPVQGEGVRVGHPPHLSALQPAALLGGQHQHHKQPYHHAHSSH